MSAFATAAARALAAQYRIYGEAAVYTPQLGGTPIACTVVLDRSDRELAFGQGRPIAQGRVLKVRASEIAEPVKDAVFAIGDENLTVQDDPHMTDDPDRLEWTMTVR